MRSRARRPLAHARGSESALGSEPATPPHRHTQSRDRQGAVTPSLAALLLFALPAAATSVSFHVTGADPGSWPEALSALGLVPAPAADADVIVIRPGVTAAVQPGKITILEGASPLAESLGFRASGDRVTVRSVVDARAPELGIVWESAAEVPRFTVPANARVFARERWGNAPLLAGFRQGDGAVLWLATDPGPRGYSRYPYLGQALADLGFSPAFHSRRLWSFFDSSYRARVDLNYFAPRWRRAGIAALHVAAWHYWERDPENDAYLRRLIEACHRNAIQVYAWLELPHVSERFWDQHPEWREKTALGQDAKLDWRKLMNLTNRDAFRAVSSGLAALIGEFDWDGVNLAELYFESLEGHENPARFTPLNADVRAEFRAAHGSDPLTLFNTGDIRPFLDFRAELARRQQAEWIAEIEKARAKKPWLDLVLTHVDDRLDPTIRDKTGADASKTLPLLEQHNFTFLVEDPATLWHLGPQRYTDIASRYRALTPRADRLAVDINIVERYQDVYPTKQQTGLELFSLVHTASAAFPRVALYFESSIAPADLALLPASAASATAATRSGESLTVTSRDGAGVMWSGSAAVDGKLWPVANDSIVWLPPGTHTVERSAATPAMRLLDLNADLLSAATLPDGLEFTYRSTARAFALFDPPPARILVDGAPSPFLPPGEHRVTVSLHPDTQTAQ